MSTTQYVIANNVNTQLAAAASSSATTLTLASSANLPTLSAGQQMPLTLNDAATGQNYEIVYVTAITGVTLTVLRAQEGTGALTWNVGDYAFCGPTAGTVATTDGNPNNQFMVAAATAANQAPNLGQLQGGGATYAVATGTANAHVIALTPALTSRVDGMMIRYKAPAANTGALTLNDGLGAVAVVGGAHAALQGGETVTNGDVWVQWNSSIGGGSYIMLDSSGGALQIAPATAPEHAVQFAQLPVVVGSMRNAKMAVAAASSSATFTADEIMVESALGGLAYRLAVYSKTINLATTGAGGMDTGSAPTNGWVALYAILNPILGTASILAVNCTSSVAPNVYGGANMPSGYTASALIGIWATDSSGRFTVGVQRDRVRSYPPIAALTTSTVAGSYTSLITSTIPQNAVTANFTLFVNNNSGSSMSLNIATDSGGSGQQSIGGFVAANDALQNNASILISTAQTLYYQSASGTGTPTYQIVNTGFIF